MQWPRYLIGGLIILILQLIACEFANFWPPLYIAVIPLFIILLPNNTNTYLLMLCGFVIGLLTDALADGVLGLNAAACVMVAATKSIVIKPLVKYDAQSTSIAVSSREFSWRKFLPLLTICYTLFFAIYLTLDGLGSHSISFFFVRLALNLSVNVALAYLLESLWIGRYFS